MPAKKLGRDGLRLLHGVGNGILTIAIGTLPLMFFGAKRYGQRQGVLMVPAWIVQAGAPFLFNLAVERLDVDALDLGGPGAGGLPCAATLGDGSATLNNSRHSSGQRL